MKRVFLITGASGGLGRQLVATLSPAHHVIATDLAGSPTRLDVTSAEDWSRVVSDVMQEHGRIDVLMNVAGVAKAGNFSSLERSEIGRHFDINVKGAALGIHSVLPSMMERGAGHIVNVASLAALAPVPGIALYSASKFALRALSIALSMELANTGVDVSVVHPDLIDTPMIVAQRHEPDAALSFSGGRTLVVEEVVKAIVDDVLTTRPLEASIPRSRGAMCRLVNAFPQIAKVAQPILRRRGLTRQRSERDERSAANL